MIFGAIATLIAMGILAYTLYKLGKMISNA